MSDRFAIFKSPLILALVGLLGTGFGAAFQGFWNARLERQKFESEMIKLALQEKTQQDKAIFLNFLKSTQIVTLFDLKDVNDLAEKGQLPNVAALGQDRRLGPFEQSLPTAAIRGFQKLICVTEDGTLGEVTREALIRYLGEHGLKDMTAPDRITVRDGKALSDAIAAGKPNCS